MRKGNLSQKRPELQVFIPACAEADWLPHTLASLNRQRHVAFEVWVFVNHAANASAAIIADNAATHAYLNQHRHSFSYALHVLETRLPPSPAVAGVGWARDTLARTIIEQRGSDTLLISLDADTLLDADYLAEVQTAFARYPNAIGLAAPYYHHAPQDEPLAFGLLRYELYMRYYQIHLWRIGCPYAFLPLGSAMAFRSQAFLKIGGIPHRQAGEDFYFLAKLRKMGPLIRFIPAKVYPASRPSQRVPFGTGQLIGNALAQQQQRFPFYDPADFDRIHATYQSWPQWYIEDPQDFPLRTFWDAKLGGNHTIAKMRRNARDAAAFIRACHEKLDGLRVLQALRYYRERTEQPKPDHQALGETLHREGLPGNPNPLSDLATMASLRDQLAAREAQYQQAFMADWDPVARW